MESNIWGNEAQAIEASVNSSGSMNYFKIKDQELKRIRLLGTRADGFLIRGWLTFGMDNKPMYSTLDKPFDPDQLGLDKYGNKQQIWEFWMVPIWNHDAGIVQLWEIRQKTIQKALFGLTDPKNVNKQWADWRNYDIEIFFNNSNSPLDKYRINPYPPAELSSKVMDHLQKVLPGIKMDDVFNGKDPLENIHQEPLKLEEKPVDNRPFIQQISHAQVKP